MIVFVGDYVLYNDKVQQVADTDGDMMLLLDDGTWVIANETEIDGVRSNNEVAKFLSDGLVKE